MAGLPEKLVSALRRPAIGAGLRRPLAVLAVLCAIAVIALGVHYAGTSEASPLDDSLHSAARAVSSSVPFALVIDAGGEPIGAISLILVIGAVCAVTGRWRLAVLTVASQGLIGSTTNLVKPLFDRTIHEGFLSYPSGHAAGATAFGLVVALLVVDLLGLGRRAALALVVGLTTAVGALASWAQTVLVAHYATDTVGGFLMAPALVVLAAIVIDAAASRLVAAGTGPRP